MGDNLTRDRRLPAWLRKALVWAGAVTAIAGALSAVVALLPDPPAPLACHRYDASYNEAAIVEFSRRPPVARFRIDEKFEFWKQGDPVSLSEVTIAASPELMALERRLSSANNGDAKNSLFFVHAPGGSGKTPLMEYLRDRHALAYLNLTQLNEALKQGNAPWVTREPELQIAGKQVSWLPKLTGEAFEGGLDKFVARISGKAQDLSVGLLLDSIDEVHPDSVIPLLKLVAKWTAEHPTQVVIVAGRGEAFRGYLVETDYRAVQEIRIPSLYLGDEGLLKWYMGDYVAYKSRVAIPPSEELAQLDVGLRQLTAAHPFTTQYLYPAALANFAFEHVRYAKEDSHRLEALMFQTLIARNQRTHNRPSKQDGSWTLYRDALVQIARRYAPDKSGVFLVGAEDTACVKDGEKYAEVNVASVLMRSGLVDLNPVNVSQLEFLFWPRSLHRFLASGDLE